MEFFTTASTGAKTFKKSRRSVQLRLLQERKIFLGREVDARLAASLMRQLFFLEADDPEREITLYINSPGGEVTSGMAIYDTIRMIKPPVATVATGLAASIATIILVGGTTGKRQAFPNSRILIHQPLGGVRGQATDIEIHAREILKVKEKINRLLADHTRQPLKKIEKDTNRDFWMSAEEAREYGIIDTVLTARPVEPSGA